ncbi:GIY-YIG nuclease family protein [Kitasatospora sp. NPDC087271]|uniref:GIY-YIG nuclease family protein n=1 Tax=Kitasatospora sp. NPDC087271 TaxID=3364067 RepID=UPI00382C38E7
MTRPRSFRLAPWVVRALIPNGYIGAYVLYRHGAPHYIGRSDTCVRRRLLQHCASVRGEYFTYDVHTSADQAFTAECSLYHVLRPHLTNVLHPDRPNYSQAKCPFCPATLLAVRQQRLSIPAPRTTSLAEGTR